MNENGIMQTGWLLLGDRWFYLLSNGKMVTGSQAIDGKIYHFNKDGVLQ